MNAQARAPGLNTASIVGIGVGLASTVVILVVLCTIFLVRYRANQRVRAALTNRVVMLRQQAAQQRLQEPTTTYTLQQPHHINSLSSEATRTSENGVLHPTVPYTLESELQNEPPPTYSVSSRYPVFINEASQNAYESTSHGEEPAQELPPPYIP